MKKTLCYIIILSVILISFAGCWSRHELDTLAIITALGIDKAESNNKILLTFQILKPGEIKSKGSSSKSVWTFTSIGETVFEAFRNAAFISDRKLFLSQCRVFVIGEEMARSGLIPVVDLLDRDPEARRTNYFLVSKGKANTIIKSETEQESFPALAIENLMKSIPVSSYSVPSRLRDFLKMVAESGREPIVAKIEPILHGKKTKMRLNGSAIFFEDKLVSFLDNYETRGYNWITGNVDSGVIIVKSPEQENKKVSLEIIRASSKITPKIQDGKIVIDVHIYEEGNLAEQMSQVNLVNKKAFKELEKKKASVIKKEAEAAIRKAKKHKTDIFGFGQAIYRKYPNEWKILSKNWQGEFQDLEININVDAKLRTIGVSTWPVKIKKGK